MPTALTKVRLASRDWSRTASSAAIQPPNEVDPVETEGVKEIEVEIGEITDLIEPGRVVGAAEAGMLRGVNREIARQLVEKRHPAGMPAGAVQEDERRRSVTATPQQANLRAGHCYELFDPRHLVEYATFFDEIIAR